MIQGTVFNSSHLQSFLFTLLFLRIHNGPKSFFLLFVFTLFFLLECLTMFNSSRLQPNRIEVLMFQLCWCAEISFYFLFFSLNNGPKILNVLFFSLSKCITTFNSPHLQPNRIEVLVFYLWWYTKISHRPWCKLQAPPNHAIPAFLLPFTRLDVNPGLQLCKLKHQVAQIDTKIATAPRIEGWESGSSRGMRRRTEGGGMECSPWQRPKAPRCADNNDLRSGGWDRHPSCY